MADVPARSAIRITGLVPNVVSYNAQGQPSYRKINAAPANPTTVQPETAKLVSLSNVKDSGSQPFSVSGVIRRKKVILFLCNFTMIFRRL